MEKSVPIVFLKVLEQTLNLKVLCMQIFIRKIFFTEFVKMSIFNGL